MELHGSLFYDGLSLFGNDCLSQILREQNKIGSKCTTVPIISHHNPMLANDIDNADIILSVQKRFINNIDGIIMGLIIFPTSVCPLCVNMTHRL